VKGLCVLLLALLAVCSVTLRAAEEPNKAKEEKKKSAEAKVDKTVAKEEQQRFHFTMEALGLFRTDGAKSKELFDVEGFVNSRDLQDSGDLAVTPKLTFSYDISKCDAIEASYFGFGLMDWEGSRTLADLGGDLSTKYESELNHNAELTYRRTLVSGDCGKLLAGSGVLGGVRYMNIDESLTLDAAEIVAGPPITVHHTFSTSNDLVGAQIGGVLALNPHKCVRVELTGKAAFMANMIDKTARAVGTMGSGAMDTDGTEFAFVGDISAKVSGKVHKNIWLTAGYGAMFVEGVALAPEQELLSHKVKTGDVIYHGFTAGLTIKW
jgi:hypothetical protein